MLVLEGNNPDLFNKVQEKNLSRQYDLLVNCVEIGLEQGPTAFNKYTLSDIPQITSKLTEIVTKVHRRWNGFSSATV